MTKEEELLDWVRSRGHAHKHGVSPHLCRDHRPSYVPGTNQRAAATGIKSKFELLELTKRLYIEYFDKSEPSYVSLLSIGGSLYDLVDSTPQSRERFCELECHWLQDAAERLEMVKQDLTSLSTAVYLGAQTALWQSIEGEQNTPIATTINNNSIAMLKVASGAEESISICGRAVFGPLRVASGLFATSNVRVQYFAHCESYLGTLPLFPGNPATLVSSFKLVDKSRFSTETARLFLSSTAGFHVNRRERLVQDPSVSGHSHNFSISNDIYLPPNLMKPLAQASIRKAIKESVNSAKARLRVPAGRYNDEWRLKSIDSTPTCQACFWEPCDRRMKRWTYLMSRDLTCAGTGFLYPPTLGNNDVRCISSELLDARMHDLHE